MGVVANLSVVISATTKEFESAITGLNSSVTGLGSTLNNTAKAVGAVFAAIQIGDQIQQVTTLTSHIDDLARKSGISASAVQELDYAARQSGSSFDQISNALALMGNRLVEGDKSVVSSLQAMGLSFEDIRAMSPDQAFQAIGEAIATLPPGFEQSKAALDFFGRSGSQLLPVLTSDIGALRDRARDLGVVIGDDLVAKGDQLDDTWATVQQRMDNVRAQALLPLLEGFTSLSPAMQTTIGAGLEMAPMLGGIGLAISGLTPLVTGLAGALMGTGGLVAALTAAGAALLYFGSQGHQAAVAADAMAGVVVSGEGMVTVMDTAGAYVEDYDSQLQALSLHLGAAWMQQDTMTRSVFNATPAMDAAAKAAAKWTAEQEKANQALISFGNNEAGMVWFELDAAMQNASARAPAFTAATMEMGTQMMRMAEATRIATNEAKGLTEDGLLPTNTALQQTLQNTIVYGHTIKAVDNDASTLVQTTASWRHELTDLAKAFGQLGSIGGSALGSIAQGFGTAVNALNVGVQGISMFGKGLSQLGSGNIMSSLTNLFGGISSIASVAALAWQGISKLIGHLKGGEEGMYVNPARDAFLSQWGDPSNKDVGGAGWNLAALLTSMGAGEGGGSLFANLQHADTMAEFNAAKTAIEQFLAQGGGAGSGIMTGDNPFPSGPFTPGDIPPWDPNAPIDPNNPFPTGPWGGMGTGMPGMAGTCITFGPIYVADGTSPGVGEMFLRSLMDALRDGHGMDEFRELVCEALHC